VEYIEAKKRRKNGTKIGFVLLLGRLGFCWLSLRAVRALYSNEAVNCFFARALLQFIYCEWLIFYGVCFQPAIMSSSHLFPFSTVPFRRVGKVQFSVWNPEELKGYSMTQKIKRNNQIIPAGIFTHELYRNGEPVDGGLADPRMGSLWSKDDPGYFGHIELARPVYHVGFIKMVLSILRCVSMYDGKFLFHEEKGGVVWEQMERLHGRARLRELVKYCAKYRV
jgi:hypothetical protein